MSSRKMKISTITSLLLGLLMFLVFGLIEGLFHGVVLGILAAVGTFWFLFASFTQSEETLNNLKSQYPDEAILYADAAGLMLGGKELAGALLITTSHIAFEPNGRNKTYSILLEAEKTDYYVDSGGFLIVHCEDNVYTFKVFHAPGPIEK